MWNIARNCRLQRVKPKVLFLRCDNIIDESLSRCESVLDKWIRTRGDETNIRNYCALFTAETSELFCVERAKTIENKKKIFYKITYVLAFTRIELRRFSSCRYTLIHVTREPYIIFVYNKWNMNDNQSRAYSRTV